MLSLENIKLTQKQVKAIYCDLVHDAGQFEYEYRVSGNVLYSRWIEDKTYDWFMLMPNGAWR